VKFLIALKLYVYGRTITVLRAKALLDGIGLVFGVGFARLGWYVYHLAVSG